MIIKIPFKQKRYERYTNKTELYTNPRINPITMTTRVKNI